MSQNDGTGKRNACVCWSIHKCRFTIQMQTWWVTNDILDWMHTQINTFYLWIAKYICKSRKNICKSWKYLCNHKKHLQILKIFVQILEIFVQYGIGHTHIIETNFSPYFSAAQALNLGQQNRVCVCVCVACTVHVCS